MARLCRDCQHFVLSTNQNQRAEGLGLCRFNPSAHAVKNDWWCGRIKLKKVPTPKSEEAKAIGANAKKVIKYYCDYFTKKWGSTPTITKADSGAVLTLLKGRDVDEVEWIIAEYLENPPSWNKEKGMKALRHILMSVTKGQIIDRPRGQQPLEDFFDEQAPSCMSDKMWDMYRAFIKTAGERIPYIDWEENWGKK